MSTFEVLVLPIDSVYDHPGADRLSICKIRGYEAITNKDENGNHRFAAGELVVYVPENAVIPLDVLKDRGYCNENGQGMLAGSQGNRVRAIRLRGHLSLGLVWKVKTDGDRHWIEHSNQTQQDVAVYDNVVEFFGIQKYEEPIPSSMSGQLFACHKAQFSYDIENWQNYPEFLVNDEVEVLEKIHGCADYDTIVETVEFGKIKIGDLVKSAPEICHVKSFNINTNEIEFNLIEGYSEQENNNDWYDLEFDDITVRLTGNHPVYLPELKCYRTVRNLIGGELILCDEE